MKRLKSLLCMLVIVLGSMCLWACGDEKEKEVTLTSVTTNLEEFYSKTDTINWDELKVTLNYSDKFKKEYGADVGEFDVEVSSAKESTKWVLATDGLKEQTAGNMTKKKYNLVLSIVGQEATYPIRVVVGVNEAVVYTLANFNLPGRIASFQENTKVEETGTNKNGFKTVENAKYYVGADNGFDITPSYTLYEKDSTNETGKTDSTFKISLDVKVLQGTTAVGSEIYSYDDKGTIQFTSDAVGKEFTIKIKPTFFTKDNSGYDIEELSFDVTVADGYNIYTAKDLGMLCVPTSYDAINATNYDRNKLSGNFWVGKDQASDELQSKRFVDIWKPFLNTNGYDTNKSINGIFIQNDIKITKDDIPADYFIQNDEGDESYARGMLRDDVLIYSHYMASNFTFQGNYFTINASGLPVNGQIWREYLKGAQDNPGEFGHTSLFAFVGQYVANTTEGVTKTSSNTHELNVLNVNTIGNTGGIIAKTSEGEDSDVYPAAGGLIMFKNAGCPATADNIVISNGMIAWFTDHTDSEENNLTTGNQEKSKAQPTVVKNANISNCFNSAIFLYGAQGGLDIQSSSLKNFGGPAIMAISEYKTSTNNGAVERQSDVSYDNQTEIINYIGSGSAWFLITAGASTIIQNFTALDTLFNVYGSTIMGTDNNASKFNLKVLVMTEDYIVSNGRYLYGKVNNFNFDVNDSNNSNKEALGTYSINGGAPMIMTNGESKPEGSISYYNLAYIGNATANNQETTLLFDTSTNNYINPTSGKLCGSELCLFYPIDGSKTDSASVGVVVDRYDYVTDSN